MNMPVADVDVGALLSKRRVIAVVGLSRNPSKDSYRVAEYLKSRGHRIIPVNPFASEILGERAYPSLSAVPEELKQQIDIIDIFRPSSDVLPVVEEAVEIRKKYGKPDVIWMQEGIVNEEAADLARKAGMKVIMDLCIMTESKKLEKLEFMV
ncbi:MAG: CoA-binding protein [Thermoproteota archaeon]|nr:MAG: CoA-binding protein [Candidatus Korarchaeota archaeon]RLG55960.1 MAG: CoA-binding protein [Candidatus Korarchaeota archaeon]